TEMEYYPDFTSKVETTLRMGLKGGIHYLGTDESPIHITKMHFHGWQHHKRNLDVNRIIGRMQDLRPYCSFDLTDQLIDDRSGNHKTPEGQTRDRDDCDLLQLADLMVTGSRCIMGLSSRIEHYEVAEPIKVQLIDKFKDGRRMANSRWSGGFWMSQGR